MISRRSPARYAVYFRAHSVIFLTECPVDAENPYVSWHTGSVIRPAVLLTRRLHVDLQRLISAAC